MRRELVPIALAAILLGMILFFAFQHEKEDKQGVSVQTGNIQLPDMVFRTLDGREVRLSQYRGKVVLLNFWASWCPPCREEMPIFEQVYNRYKDKGFEILAVNMDDSEESMKRFLEKNKLSFTILRPTGDLEKELRLMGLPTSYLIDRNGKVVKMHLGVYRDLEKDLISQLHMVR
ncbi:Redoxin domain protein [Thermocrinis albus DSM 14484]|uniref:Redoxin domain protein n=1 Tax=Thermocrinis albus (strain DSM 14484 / JCM 11386 / HI 11/12) TaxID=638303 RepID=D3SPE3_THEAH|nr:Redoxin domain protein [Thermocrinis albus DSM 14484]